MLRHFDEVCLWQTFYFSANKNKLFSPHPPSSKFMRLEPSWTPRPPQLQLFHFSAAPLCEGGVGIWGTDGLSIQVHLRLPVWYCVSSAGNTDLIWHFGISDPSLPSFIPSFHGILAEKPSVFYSSNKKGRKKLETEGFCSGIFFRQDEYSQNHSGRAFPSAWGCLVNSTGKKMVPSSSVHLGH